MNAALAQLQGAQAAQATTIAAQNEELTTARAQREQMQRQLVFLNQEKQNLQGQLNAATADVQNLRASGTQGRQAEKPPSLIDSRSITKPPPFRSEEGKFSDFAFKYVNLVTSAFPNARKAMKWAAEQDDAITDYSPFDLDGILDHEEIGRQIYISLAQLLEGEALTILKNCPEDEGLEAWRKECARWDPLTTGRTRNMLENVIEPDQCARLDSLSGKIEEWEQEVQAEWIILTQPQSIVFLLTCGPFEPCSSNVTHLRM